MYIHLCEAIPAPNQVICRGCAWKMGDGFQCCANLLDGHSIMSDIWRADDEVDIAVRLLVWVGDGRGDLVEAVAKSCLGPGLQRGVVSEGQARRIIVLEGFAAHESESEVELCREERENAVEWTSARDPAPARQPSHTDAARARRVPLAASTTAAGLRVL